MVMVMVKEVIMKLVVVMEMVLDKEIDVEIYQEVDNEVTKSVDKKVVEKLDNVYFFMKWIKPTFSQGLVGTRDDIASKKFELPLIKRLIITYKQLNNNSYFNCLTEALTEGTWNLIFCPARRSEAGGAFFLIFVFFNKTS